MATTSLFVEIIVIGALAELWFVTFLIALQPQGSIAAILERLPQLDSFGGAIVGVLLAVTYAVGWAINFLAERTFKSIFERRVRDRLFDGSPTTYRDAHTMVLQKGSTDLLHEFVLDRHVIRIARSNVFNFLLLGVGLLVNGARFAGDTLTILVAACWSVALASFFQWWTRYESYYTKLAGAARVVGG